MYLRYLFFALIDTVSAILPSYGYTLTYLNNIYIYIYTYRYTACVAQLANASDTQAVGHGYETLPDH